MKTIDWKGEYINYLGVNIADVASYISIAGSKTGDGGRNNPFHPNVTMSSNTNFVFGNGNFEIAHNYANTSSLVGNSRNDTCIRVFTHHSATGQTRLNKYFASLRIMRLNISAGGYSGNYYFRDCILDNLVYSSSLIPAFNVSNCIYIGIPLFIDSAHVSTIQQNTYFNLSLTADTGYYLVRTGQALIVGSQITVNQSLLTNNYTYYTAFNNCKFVIGSETTATPLSGNNADEMRADFVNRCVAQGLTVPTVNEYGGVVSVGRWVFSKTSIVGDYDTLEGSEIDMFAKIRGIYLGHTSNTVKQVPITTTLNIPASFNTQTPVNSALVQENSIGLLANSDITTRVEAYADSKIIWLGGLCKLTTLDLTHNLPVEAGVVPDSVLGFSKTTTPSGSVEVGNHYIIRSNNDSMATIKYNNVEYTSSLITRNNVFLGVTGVTTFENVTGNAEVFQVLDFANHQSIQIRLMREIPTGNITGGNLQAGYWYFVEPNNLSDTSGTITYKNIVRPAFDSFLADAANLTFTVNGACHLRRCWKQDFNYDTEATDKAFWTDRQKPYYFDVVSSDLRCLLKNHSSASVELATGEDGMYIGSGHPEFYNSINGVNGIKMPAYDIVGSFLQIRVPITTRNLM